MGNSVNPSKKAKRERNKAKNEQLRAKGLHPKQIRKEDNAAKHILKQETWMSASERRKFLQENPTATTEEMRVNSKAEQRRLNWLVGVLDRRMRDDQRASLNGGFVGETKSKKKPRKTQQFRLRNLSLDTDANAFGEALTVRLMADPDLPDAEDLKVEQDFLIAEDAEFARLERSAIRIAAEVQEQLGHGIMLDDMMIEPESDTKQKMHELVRKLEERFGAQS